MNPGIPTYDEFYHLKLVSAHREGSCAENESLDVISISVAILPQTEQKLAVGNVDLY